jgi:hypothetical protein
VRIEDRAFVECSSLSSIFIPARLESLNASAFVGTKLREISVAEENRHFKVSGFSHKYSRNRDRNVLWTWRRSCDSQHYRRVGCKLFSVPGERFECGI